MYRALVFLVLLAACATPQQACINKATREGRVLDRLIAEVEANLTRGYALVERTAWQMDWRICTAAKEATADTPAQPAEWCWVRAPYVVEDRVAIDPAAEQRKLDGLTTRRRAEARRAEMAIQECRALYPE